MNEIVDEIKSLFLRKYERPKSIDVVVEKQKKLLAFLGDDAKIHKYVINQVIAELRILAQSKEYWLSEKELKTLVKQKNFAHKILTEFCEEFSDVKDLAQKYNDLLDGPAHSRAEQDLVEKLEVALTRFYFLERRLREFVKDSSSFSTSISAQKRFSWLATFVRKTLCRGSVNGL